MQLGKILNHVDGHWTLAIGCSCFQKGQIHGKGRKRKEKLQKTKNTLPCWTEVYVSDVVENCQGH